MLAALARAKSSGAEAEPAPADPAVKPEPSEPAPPARARTPRGNDGLSEDVSWAVDESGAKDDEFVVDAALEADGADDMETFEEELENAPIDLEAVKMEVNALKKESEMPIERLMRLYRVPPSEQNPSEAAKDSDSDDDSSRDSRGSESRSASDSETGREDEDAAGHLPAFKSEAPEGNPRRRSLTVAGMERPEPSSAPIGAPPMTYATREEARAAALAEGRRIRYEEEVMDRAWHLLHRPPRTKPQPHFPEPARNKTHWDHLLEEMKWLSGDFVRERKFRHKLARKAAYAVARSNLDLESRVIKRAQDEAAAQRKTARNIANEVMHFWIKIEKVVRFKAQSAIDAKRKTVMDKHLDFLLGQTERYSTMLATKLTGGEGGESSGRSTPRSASVEALPAVPEGNEEDPDADEYRADDDEMAAEDDEATLEEEMRRAEEEDEGDAAAEINDLAADAEVPIEELLKQYREMEEAANAKASGSGDVKPEDASMVKVEDEAKREPEGDEPVVREDTFADIVEDAPVKGKGKAPEDDGGEYLGESEDDADDEATLEEEMRRAEEEDEGDAAAEINDLAADAEVPIEELMRRYREMEAAHGGGDEEQNGDEEEEDGDGDERGRAEVSDDEDEFGVDALVDDAPEMTAEEKRASDERRRVLDSLAGDAGALQPKGNTLDSADVKCRVPFLLKHTLREYQHVGLNWLVSCYDKALNGILADEMGLGKTIQTISLLAYLACECGIWGPHLIVVPTSVMLNWEVEFKKWAPAFKLLTYFGTAKERKLKRQGWSKPNSFHVCITTYRLITQDARVFRRKKWKYLILDEAHMIKNWRSQRWQTLLNFNSKRRLLITGTPLQNDLMELWSLMHFLMPHVFQSHSEFKNWFSQPLAGMVEGGEGVNMDLVSRLHGVLRPFLLRRLKTEVEKNLPGKTEHVVHCGLSKRQRRLYEEYMASSDTSTTLASGNLLGIINCLMQLRKVCNHPDLFAGRPIVSAFDMLPGVTLRVPSIVANDARTRHEDPLGAAFFAPRGLHLLTLEDVNCDGDGACREAWAAAEAARRAADPEEVENTLAEGGAYARAVAPPGRMGRMTPAADAAVRLFRDARAAAAKVERRAVARRIAIAAAAAVRRAPVYGADLRRAVKVSLAARDCHVDAGAFGAGPFAAAPALLSAVKRPTTRATESKDLIATFMFAIPKARAPPPTMTCSAPCASIRTAEARDKSWSQKVGWPALAPLRQASVRQQLFFPDRRLVQFDCGKLQALAQLLRTLKSGGHKVLIFTQMTKMLDILEAFLNLYGYPYCRLDGSTRPEQRQILMQRFNTDPRLFVFILSTRSGGFGINLTGADTVVFYDSDWNPAMDQQAQDRAHRIGQTREVHIYRLVCKGTIEENILKKSMQKRELDHFAIQAGNFNTEHFKKMSAAGGGDAEGSGDENRQRGDVVGGQQGAAAMSIFDRAMSRAAAPAKDSDAGGEGEGARKGTGATAKGAGAEDDDEVGRLMDEAQDDVDKAAAAATAREDADEAAEFGDDIKETADPDAETDDAKLARAKSQAEGLGEGSGGGGEPPSTPADAGAGASRPANDGELAMVPINTSLEGDDQFAQDMMRKVQMSASKGESLEQQLRPVERYAVRYLEETVRIMDDVDATATAIADFEEKEWELEQMEKQKAAAEAAEEDDELIIEGWETADATDEYRKKVEQARQEAELAAERERLERERWAAMYATPSAEAAAAGTTPAQAAAAAVGDVSKAVASADPFAAKVPRRSRSASPAPGAGGAGAPLRVKFRFRGAAGAPSTLGPGTADVHTGADSGHGEKRKDRNRDDERREKRHKKHHAHKDETPEEREARRRLRRLSKEHDRAAAAAAMGGADGAIGTPHATPRPASNVASPSGVMMTPAKPPGSTPPSEAPWRGAEDVVLCALVNEFGGASWDLAADAIAAAGMGARVSSSCKDRFRRLIARHGAALGAATGAGGGQLRVTPELTRALLRVVARDAFAGGGVPSGVPSASVEGTPSTIPPAVAKMCAAAQGVRARFGGSVVGPEGRSAIAAAARDVAAAHAGTLGA